MGDPVRHSLPGGADFARKYEFRPQVGQVSDGGGPRYVVRHASGLIHELEHISQFVRGRQGCTAT